MSEKRKDSKGRVLKDGESQRVNGTYDYRYTDIHKKRRCIYAKSLTELRKKEDELRRDMADGIDYAAGEMTVAELVDRYMNLKRGLKQNSLRSYGSAVKRIHADPFGQKPIKTVALRRKGLVRVSALQRHTATDDLAKRCQIRLDMEIFLCATRCQTESCDNFIEDQ